MDTSEQYIKMCEKAEEIQALWEAPRKQDWCAPRGVSHPDYFGVDIYNSFVFGTGPNIKEQAIWLPRQDQLQEMVGYKGLPYLLTQAFERSVNGGATSYIWGNGKHFTSMEQLWLAFVMGERYHKVWNGITWKKLDIDGRS